MPEPDSPTMPTVSPLATTRSTLRTAVTVPLRVANSTVRSRDIEQRLSYDGSRHSQLACPWPHVRRCGSTMSRRPSPSRLKVNTASISASAGEQRQPPLAGNDVVGAFRDHDAPFRRRRAHAETDEREAGGIEDRPAQIERDLHHHRRQRVGKDVQRQDAPVAVAGQPRRLHEAGVAADVHLGARHARVERQVDDGGGVDDVLDRVAERRDDAHRQHEQRERHDRIADAADEPVGPAAEVARHRTRAPSRSRTKARPPQPRCMRSSRAATTTREKTSRPS